MCHQEGKEAASCRRWYRRKGLAIVFDEEPTEEPDPGLVHSVNLVSDFAS